MGVRDIALFLRVLDEVGEARGACGGSDFALFLEGAEGESARTVGWRRIALLLARLVLRIAY